MRLRRSIQLAAVLISGWLWSVSAQADWHLGRVTSLGFAYDGSTVVLSIEGVNRNNCTCYSSWPSNMCLNRSRLSFKEEFAWLVKAKAMDQAIYVNVDEATCYVEAMYEAG